MSNYGINQSDYSTNNLSEYSWELKILSKFQSSTPLSEYPIPLAMISSSYYQTILSKSKNNIVWPLFMILLPKKSTDRDNRSVGKLSLGILLRLWKRSNVKRTSVCNLGSHMPTLPSQTSTQATWPSAQASRDSQNHPVMLKKNVNSLANTQ